MSRFLILPELAASCELNLIAYLEVIGTEVELANAMSMISKRVATNLGESRRVYR